MLSSQLQAGVAGEAAVATELAESRLFSASRSMRKLMMAAYNANSLWLLQLHLQE